MGFYSKRNFNNKYKARKTTANGTEFASKLEATVYLYFELEKAIGKIKAIELQPKVYMTEAKILMKPDFKITRNDDSYFYAEAKGLETQSYAIKKRLWKHYGDGELHVYKGTQLKIYLDEIVKPIASTKK